MDAENRTAASTVMTTISTTAVAFSDLLLKAPTFISSPPIGGAEARFGAEQTSTAAMDWTQMGLGGEG